MEFCEGLHLIYQGIEDVKFRFPRMELSYFFVICQPDQNHVLTWLGETTNFRTLALEEFEKETISVRQRGLIRMRSITNYGMGAFIVVAGFFFMFPTSLTRPFLSQYEPTMLRVFAVICWVYGAFRIYRGYAKNYFRD